MEEQKKYYYFIEGHDQVYFRYEYICDGDGKHDQYQELSNRQLEWYLAHPGASAHEVKQLCTDEEFRVRGLPPLNEYKSYLCGLLTRLSDQRITTLIPVSKLADALLDQQAMTAGEETIIGGDTARVCQDRIRYYTAVRKTLKKEAARVRLQIGMAATHQEAEAAFSSHHFEEVKTGKEDWGSAQGVAARE